MSQLFLAFVTLLFIITTNGDTIRCSSCNNQQIYCANNEDCIVNCEQCESATIYCPNTAHFCNVTCSTSTGQRSCYNTVIDAFTQGSNGTKLNVIAGGHNDILQGGIIKCPSHNGQCNVYCSSDFACRSLQIHGENAYSTDITLNVTGNGAFINGQIYGAPYGTITVDCDGYEACKGPNVIAAHLLSLSMDITAYGTYVLAATEIYCPSNGADKSVICTIDLSGPQAMQNGKIFAKESFYDIDFFCDPSYHEGCLAITLYCGDNGAGYSSSCPLVLSTGATASNQWQCSQSYYECQTFSYAPTTTNIPTTTAITSTSTSITNTLTSAPTFPSSALNTTNISTTSITNTSVTTTTAPTFPSTSTVTTGADTTSVTDQRLYGVYISIIFGYDVLLNNYSNMSMARIFNNISSDLFDIDVGEIDDNCVDAKHHDLSIDEVEKIVIINATVYVCNKETETILIAYYVHELEADLLQIIDKNPILIAIPSGIKIHVETIEKEVAVESTFYSLTTTDLIFDIIVDDDDDSVFGIIMLLFGIIIFLGIAILIICCVLNGRKDIERNKSLDVAFADNAGSGRMRIPTVSVMRSSIDNTHNEKRVSFIDDPITPPGTAPKLQVMLAVCEDSASGNNKNGDTTPVDVSVTIGTEDDVRRKEVRQWLADKVGLEQYCDAFVENGYDSLHIIKEIESEEQLKEIGVVLELHTKKLMEEIGELRVVYDGIEPNHVVDTFGGDDPNTLE